MPDSNASSWVGASPDLEMPDVPAQERKLAQTVAGIRKGLGMTQDNLAAAMWQHGHHSFSHSVVSRIESGARTVSAIELVDLAAVLGVGVADLTGAAQRPSSDRDPLALRVERELLAIRESLHTVMDREIDRRLARLTSTEEASS